MRQQLALVLLALASQCQAQAVDYDSSNPNQDILGCDALTCAQDNENAICSFGPSGIGVGFVPRTVNLSDSTSLSLTLVDGYPLGNYGQSQETYDFSTRTLYVGAPQDTELSEQRPGCMLMMQHQSTTFPNPPTDPSYSSQYHYLPGRLSLWQHAAGRHDLRPRL